MIDVHIKLVYPRDSETIVIHCDDMKDVEQVIDEFQAQFPDTPFDINDLRYTTLG